MSSIQEEPVPRHLSQPVLLAIQGALREEKEPKYRRLLKTLGAALLGAAVLGVPFVLTFGAQLNWVWAVALALWGTCLVAGFALHFYPQPRLMVAGVWSPFVLARILLVATGVTVVQILICPSYVFLDSPLAWNPLLPLTHSLMDLGGMNLCMFFCGGFFALVSSLASLGAVIQVIRGGRLKAAMPALGILMVSQIPILAVQVLSDDLREFCLPWALGLVLGSVVGLLLYRVRADCASSSKF